MKWKKCFLGAFLSGWGVFALYIFLVADKDSQLVRFEGKTFEPADWRPDEAENEEEFEVEGPTSRNTQTLEEKIGLDEWKNDDPVCDEWFDYGFLQKWSSESFDKERCIGESEVRCFTLTHPKLNKPTSPHVVCRGKNIVLNSAKTKNAHCLKHRKNYKCEGQPTYRQYDRGAFGGACEPRFNIRSDFPGDHLRDQFDSWQTYDKIDQFPEIHPDGHLLFVTREKGEHVNMYHTLSDWLMTFQTIQMLSLDISSIQIIFLDDHVDGPLDTFWTTVFSPNFKTLRWKDLEGAKMVKNAIWVPPGYSNIMLSEVTKRAAPCDSEIHIFNNFADFVLSQYNLGHIEGKRISVVFSSRRPYAMKGIDHKFVGRQLDNEDDVIARMKTVSAVAVARVDFAQHTIQEQIKLIAEADVLVGMHGAGLSHVAFLPSWGGLLELFPKTQGRWFCFRHIAIWRGLHYDEWTNRDYPRNYREDKSGDYTKVHIEQFGKVFEKLIENVRTAKQVHRDSVT